MHETRMNVIRCCIFLLAVALMAGIPPEENTVIEGFVTSDVVAVAPGATVGVDSLARGFHRQATTDTSGYYSFNHLDPGAYSIWAEIKGVGCIIYPHVAVFAGQHVREDFHFAQAKRYPGNCEPVERNDK